MAIELTDNLREKLIQTARSVRRRAYAPYSKYPVGAALLTARGEIFSGVNVENAAYPLTMCAERTAIFSAVTMGEQQFVAIAVATSNGGSPCGACRQVLAEFGLETIVLLLDEQGKVVAETTSGALLPGAFLPDDLVKTGA